MTYIEHLREKHKANPMGTEECKYPDPYHRIGTLEGAIMGVILHLESAHPILAAKAAWNGDQRAERNAQVIANLKELVKV